MFFVFHQGRSSYPAAVRMRHLVWLVSSTEMNRNDLKVVRSWQNLPVFILSITFIPKSFEKTKVQVAISHNATKGLKRVTV